jgi:ribosomal protein S6E (S10)
LRRKCSRHDTTCITISLKETELNSTDSRQGKAEGPDKRASTKGRKFFDLLSECYVPGEKKRRRRKKKRGTVPWIY